MSDQTLPWTQVYQEIKELWGFEPNWRLLEYLHLVRKGPILDLGGGNGRNALFFAKLGFPVDYVDKSKTYSNRLRKQVEEHGLDLTVYNEEIREFEVPKKRYTLIVASKILQMFPKADIEVLTKKLNAGLARKGLLYVYTFSAENIKHSTRLHECELVEENTYLHKEYGQHFHYFTSDELLTHFNSLKTIFYNQDMVHNMKKKKNARYLFVLEYLGQRIR
jgi:cyclopropane fatty-acyl-phospholipid synthase-like methyltransferase